MSDSSHKIKVLPLPSDPFPYRICGICGSPVPPMGFVYIEGTKYLFNFSFPTDEGVEGTSMLPCCPKCLRGENVSFNSARTTAYIRCVVELGHPFWRKRELKIPIDLTRMDIQVAV